MTTPQFKQQLRDQLMDAAHDQAHQQRQRRRTRIMRTAAAGIIAGIIAAAGPIVASLQTPAGNGNVAVATSDDIITITLPADTTTTDPQTIETQLRDVGIRADVQTTPTTPDLHGRFVTVDTPDERVISGMSPTVLHVPADTEGNLTIFIGRPPHDGEHQDLVANPFARGGRLHCTGIEQLPLNEAADVLDRNNIDVRWADADTGQTTDSPPTSGRIVAATGNNPIVLMISSDPQAPSQLPPQLC